MADGGQGGLNVADVHEAIAARQPERLGLVFRDRRLRWADVDERTRRLASFLHDRGLGCHRDRSALAPWESGQDHVALYLHNGNEYLESMLGAFKARVAPCNVNYRYVADELAYLLDDAAARAIVYHSAFAPTLAGVRGDRPALDVLVQVPDGSGHALLPGAVWYEDALAAGSPAGPGLARSPDDLYILYTGGTTGPPKGVLWRQGDAFTECFGGPRVDTVEAAAELATTRLAAVVAPPFMHGAGHWVSFVVWHTGGTVFVPGTPERLVPAAVWGLVERERAGFLLIVGDAFARPLLDELAAGRYDLSCLTTLMSGGAPLSPGAKQELLGHLPHLLILDGLGSSEAGGQARAITATGAPDGERFVLGAGNHVLSAGLDRLLQPDDDELGWLAKSGRLALGYLGDADRTRATYPVVGGVRYAVPGDRARLDADGTAELLGRDSVTINSGGEKVFAEEVEAVLKDHPAVYDCVVAGRPDPRWGSAVVAVVQWRDGAEGEDTGEGDDTGEGVGVGERALLDWARPRLAAYKLPQAFVFVPAVVRSPSGKPDYRWARAVVTGASSSAVR